jgi:cytoskeletal protein CcmA (bactofilin family)
VIHQRLTFRGESRTGPDIGVDLDVGDVAGYVSGVSAAALEGGRVRATITTGDVQPGGKVVGVTLNPGEPPHRS